MNFVVYVIKSQEGHQYIGHTPDLPRRLLEHNAHTSHATKHGTNWAPIYTEVFQTRGAAMQRERFFKTGRGRDELKRILSGVKSAAAE